MPSNKRQIYPPCHLIPFWWYEKLMNQYLFISHSPSQPRAKSSIVSVYVIYWFLETYFSGYGRVREPEREKTALRIYTMPGFFFEKCNWFFWIEIILLQWSSIAFFLKMLFFLIFHVFPPNLFLCVFKHYSQNAVSSLSKADWHGQKRRRKRAFHQVQIYNRKNAFSQLRCWRYHQPRCPITILLIHRF